jgi:hypothetical protein
MTEAQNLLRYMPAGMNPRDPVLNALMADESGQGGIGNEIADAESFIRSISRNDDIENLAGEELNSVATAFLGLIKRSSDTDADFLRLFLALARRGGTAEAFGTRDDILGAFRHYLPQEVKLDLAENTADTNLVKNPDFETGQTDWTIAGPCELSAAACFSYTKGARFFGSGGTLSQTLQTKDAGVYACHAFLRGSVGVEIQNGAGEYWNFEDFAWQTAEYANIAENGTIADGFKDICVFFRMDGGFDAITVTFKYGTQEAHVDHIRAYQKPKNPSFSLVLAYPGEKIVLEKSITLNLDPSHAGGDAGNPDGSTPTAGEDYAIRGYFDNSFIVGASNQATKAFMSMMMSYMKPAGAQYFFDEVLYTPAAP